ncbi:MAG: hypothetical protein AABX33_09000 [Nanoarchaeota archaeon]
MVNLGIVGVTTVIFGITSLLLISRARSRLSEGSIRRYMDNFAICLAFIVIFSIWQTTRSLLGIDITLEGLGNYPEYIFIIFAYVAFVVASFKVLKVSEEFGFKEDGKRIDKLITEISINSQTKNQHLAKKSMKLNKIRK